MLNYFFIMSPVDQFLIFPICNWFNIGLFSFINNVTLPFIFIFIFFLYFIYFEALPEQVNEDNKFHVDLWLIPNRYQAITEILFFAVLRIMNDNIRSEYRGKFVPLIFFLFFFILLSNLVGLIPYSYTLTSQICVTFTLSVILFIGLNIICFRRHKLHIFSLFLPNGTHFLLALLLVPIEIISYVFRPISLSIRLFANMMAGHTLLKVVAGFAWSLISLNGIVFVFLHFIPFILLLPLIVLESAVAVIQAFVITVLTSIYINDALNLH